MRLLRMVGLGWWLQLKMRSRSAFDGALSVVWPLFFATSAFLVLKTGQDKQALLISTAVGSSVMGVWSALSTTAAGSLQRERSQGTLELLVAAPAPFPLVLLPIALSMATIGAYSMVATLIWARVIFGISVHVGSPVLLFVAAPVVVLSVGMLGFLMSMAVTRFRAAWALGNALEYPVWLICGFLVPLSVLPGWVHPIAWALAPTWGVEAVRGASIGGPGWGDGAVCAALAIAYGLLGAAISGRLLTSARVHATLALS